jgi:mRNA interferase RelE/StbE
MIVKIDKSFEKDTNKIKDKSLLIKIANCIESVRNADNLKSISHLKKLKGSNNHYRISIGDYRIGIYIEKNQIDFIRFLHRKDIYNYFP